MSKQTVRSLGQWSFEDGTELRITVFGNVPTEMALEYVEILIQMKRDEMARLAAKQAAKQAAKEQSREVWGADIGKEKTP